MIKGIANNQYDANFSKILWHKVGVFITISIVITPLYLYIQNLQYFEVTQIPYVKIDYMIGQNVQGIWAYQSLYLLLIIVTFQYEHKKDLHQFALGFVLIALSSFVIFVLFPTQIERPNLTGKLSFYDWFVNFETPRNAFPSMHVSVSLFAAWSLLTNRKFSKPIFITIIIWVAAIIYSTMQVKQHLFIDVLGGAIHGLLVIYFFKTLQRK